MNSRRFCAFLFTMLLVIFPVDAALAQNFGAVNVGASTTATIPVTMLTAGTLGTISVVTQGAENLDFTNAGGGTCAVGTAYAVNATCTVNVDFAPKLSGIRYGGVVLFDGAGNMLANTLVNGNGSGPQVIFPSGTESTIATGINSPSGLAVDGSGNLYIAVSSGWVLKETKSAGGYTQSTAFSGMHWPAGLAVDGSGNLYITDLTGGQVYKETLTPTGYIQSTIGSGWDWPDGITVDTVGNVYIADTLNGRVVKETPSAGGYSLSVILNCGYIGEQSCPAAVAVDASGNLFIVSYNASQVLEMTPAAGGYTQSMIGSGLDWPSMIVADGNGNLYIADTLNSRIVKETLSAGSYTQSTLTTSSLDWPWAVAVDGAGNVYVSDTYHTRVLKEGLSNPPSLSFATAEAGSTSSDSPRTVSVQNDGNQPLVFTSVQYPADFPEAVAGASPCAASASLDAGMICNLTIDFSPQSAGTLSESVSLVDNALNQSSATQAVSISGVGTPGKTAQTISFAALPNVTYPVSPVTLAATASSGLAVSYSVTGPASVAGSTLTVTGAGTVAVTASQAGNATYGAASPVMRSFTVAPVALTVTANDVSRGYDEPNPAFSVSFTGFVNGDSAGVVSGAASLTTTATEASPVGSYPIVPAVGTLAAANYSFGSFVDGTLSVTTAGFGSVAVGANKTATITVTVSTAGTVGSIRVVTQGTPNLDFTAATGGSCTVGTAYAASATCTVSVTFKPATPGLRYGSVELLDASGNLLANVYVQGIGVGPLVTFANSTPGDYGPGKQSILGSGFFHPSGVAVDVSGNLFVADTGNNTVKEILAVNGSIPPSPTIKTLGSGFNGPYGVAVDGSGNVFIGDRGDDSVKEILAAGGYTTVKTLGGGFGFGGPNGVAVDGNGNVFVADWVNDAVYEILAAGGYTTVKTLGGGFNYVDGVAVDGNGNVFVADFTNNVKEILAASGYTTVRELGSGLGATSSVAVDASGNLFVTDWSDGVAKEILAAGGYATVKTLASGFIEPNALAVDWSGNVFVADQGNSRLVKLDYADPPSLSFSPTTQGSVSADSPRTVTVINDGNADLAVSAVSYPADFPVATGDANACTGSVSLGAGQQCDLAIDFSPKSRGSLSESVTVTDNALNLIGSSQQIAVNGDAFGLQTITFGPLPNVILGVTPITLTATASSGLAVSYSVTGPASVSGSVLTILGRGTVAVTAIQAGDAAYGAATPVTRTFTVFLPATVHAETSASPATVGWPVILSATVSGAGPVPTGTLTFFSGSTALGSGTLAGGVATLTTKALGVGSYTITAKYSGDATYAAASSGSLTETVVTTPSLVLTASPNPAGAYAPFTVTATVEYPSGGPVPTGTMLFYLDKQHLGVSALSGGVATWQIGGLAPGAHALGAQFGGDSHYRGIGGAGVFEDVNKATTSVALSASPNPAAVGAQLTVTATVATTLAGKTPTGSVKFYLDQAGLGVVPLVNGVATYQTSSLTAGTHRFVVQYGGDPNYDGGDSAPVWVTVQ